MGIFRTVKRKQPQTTQPSDGKRQKVTIVKMRKPKSNAWTTEEKTVLLEAVDEHGLDFAHIKAEYGACFGDRSVSALKVIYVKLILIGSKRQRRQQRKCGPCQYCRKRERERTTKAK